MDLGLYSGAQKMSACPSRLILIGGGGHARSVLEVIRSEGRFIVHGIIDQKLPLGSNLFGIPVIGGDERLAEVLREVPNFVLGVGHIKDVSPRKTLFARALALGGKPETIIASTAQISPWSQISAGTVVFHGAVINAGVRVGQNCIINTRAVLEHDVSIGDHVHISTGVIVNGDCQVADDSFIGSGAILRQGVVVHTGALVGAGSLVLKDISAQTTFLQKRTS